MIATMLAIANEEEVALGKIVDAKSQNPNVRPSFCRTDDQRPFGIPADVAAFGGGEPGFNR